MASATAQQPTKLLEGIALESALLSTDPVSIAAASREIEKNPERQADLINRVLGRSGDPSPYSARLAISIALRQYYRDKSLVFPSADGNWLSDASWQRILLDSFDRSDVLGDTARRTLRILKSAEAKAVIDTTLPKVAGAGGSDFATCLDLLKQDIFVNWAALSFENLKKSGQFAPAQWKSLGGLLDEVTLSSSATKQNAHRLRANFVKGAILLEAAQSLPADARMDLQAEGLDELRKIQKAIQEIGLPTAKSTYPVNPAELDKTQAFLERFDKTKSLDLQILTQETAGPLKPYPNCKIS